MNLEKRLRTATLWVMAQRGLKQAEVARMLGYSQESSLSQLLNGHKKIPESLPDRFVKIFPEINLDFLLGTSNEMLKSSEGACLRSKEAPSGASKPEDEETGQSSPIVPNTAVPCPAEFVQMMADLSTTLREQQQTIRELVSALTKNL